MEDLEKRMKDFMRVEEELSDTEGDWLVDFCSATDKSILAHVYPKDWFSGNLKLLFEGLQINVPSGYDEFLTQIYGEYMTPPPEDKRVLCHDELRYYINLKERLSLEEVKRRVANGENYVF